MKKILTLVLCLFMSLTCFNTVKAEGTTLYVDPTGQTQGAYETLQLAANALPSEGGTIIIKNDAYIGPLNTATILPSVGKITIRGESQNVKLNFPRVLRLGGEVEFDNITLVNSVTASGAYAYIYCQGNSLTIGENVSTIGKNGTGEYPSIFAGNMNTVCTAVNQVINVHAGNWQAVCLGNNASSRNFSGNVSIDINNVSINYFSLVGVTGISTATVNASINNSTIVEIANKARNTNNVFQGTYMMELNGGTYNTFTGVVPSIDLKTSGNITFNRTLTASSLEGEGTINLASDAYLTVSSFEGEVSLNITDPIENTTYLTINDTSSTGVINYIPKDNEALNKTTNTNNITYTIEGGEIMNDVKLKVYYYNPDDPNNQPLIVLYKGHNGDSNKTLITDYISGNEDGKNYIEARLEPGLHFFKIYYNDKNNGRGIDYIIKYFYITGEEENDVIYDMPYTKYVVNNYEEDTSAYPTDQIINNFFNVDNLNVQKENLVTPTFTRDSYVRRFMNNEELCDFVDNLSSPYLHVYYPFELSPMGNKSPVLVFTKDNVDANITIEDLAEEINSQGTREVLMINGGQHGNEASGIEGNLQLAYDLCGAYGEDVLDYYGAIIIIPAVSADNMQRFSRYYEDGCNSNKDVLLVEHEGSQNFAQMYSLFMPSVYISCHEDNDHASASTDYETVKDIHSLSYCAMMVPNSPILNTKEMALGQETMADQFSTTLCNNLIAKANLQGFRATHYPDPQYTPLAERSYATIRGSLAFLIEVTRIWAGQAYYEYCVNEMTIAEKNIIEEIISYNQSHQTSIAQLAKQGREASKVTEFDENNKFILTMNKQVIGTEAIPSVDYNGQYVNANAVRNWSIFNVADKTRALPLSYVIPADLDNIERILNILDIHGIEYTYLPSGTSKALKEYSITDGSQERLNCTATLGENCEVTFENGAYEVSLNTSDAYLIAYLFEPDCYATTSTIENLKASFYKMGLVDASDHLYRYESDYIPTGDPSDVTFMVDDVIYESLNDVTFNSFIEAPLDPSKDGYVFIGWFKDSNLNNKWQFDKDRITEDTILYAGFVVGHKITVIDGGFNNINNAISSSTWTSATGGEITGNIASVVGDYSNSTGVPMSLYGDLSDVTAIKIKVGNNPEQSIPYNGEKITRYYKADHTIGTSGNANSDIIKLVLKNDAKATLISTRFYNINDDITITYIHNTLNINYVDETNSTNEFAYDRSIGSYLPNNNSLDVAITALKNANDDNKVNMHFELENKACAFKLNDTTVLANDLPIVDTTYGKITISNSNNIYDILIEQLNNDLIVSPIYELVSDKNVEGKLNSDGTINLNIKANINEAVDKDTAYILINNVKTNLSDLEEVNGKATIATPAMAPRQLNDSFTIRYYDGDDNPISNETTISIKDYITILLNDSNTTETGKTFYKSLLNYASYAQEYFEYNTENLANADLEESDKDVSAVTYENVLTYAANIANETEGISAYGQSLVLKSNVILRVYFTLDGSHAISEYKFYDGEELLTARRYSDNLYYVEIANTAAPDLDKNHTVEVKLGEEGSLSVTCSALTYAEIVLRDAPTNISEIKLASLMKSMYNYHVAAKLALGE